MKRSLVFITAILSLALGAFAQKPEPVKPPEVKAAQSKLPSAKEILDTYVKASGGREAILKIKTRVVRGTFTIAAAGIKGTYEGYQSGSEKAYAKINLTGIGDILIGLNGKTAWTINPLQGSRDIEGEELLQLKLSNDLYRDVNFEKLYSSLAVKGIEKVNGRDAYMITGTPAGLPEETFYFDKENGLLVRSDLISVTPEGRNPTQNYYEDYREFDGVKIPFRMRTVTSLGEITVALNTVKHGEAIDDAKFIKPKE